MSNSVIKADNIIKKYGRNYALVGVSVEIEKGRILRLGYNEENGTFTCQAAFDKLVPFDSTVEFEMKMRAALGAGKFILQLKYTPDMLCAEYSLWYLFCISSPAGPSVFWPECWRKSGIRNGTGVGMRME